MSCIRFHGRSDTALVGGRERGWLANIVKGMHQAVFDPMHWASHRSDKEIRRIFPQSSLAMWEHAKERGRDAEALKWMRHAFSSSCFDQRQVVAGKEWNAWIMELNTAMRLGGDAVRLATRIHAQVELNAYIEPEHLEWAAKTIEDNPGVFRPETQGYGSGWKDVVDLLRSEEGTVVTSYSVTDGFPGYDRVRGEQIDDWDLAVEEVKSRFPDGGLSITPEIMTWEDDEEDRIYDAFDLVECINEILREMREEDERIRKQT